LQVAANEIRESGKGQIQSDAFWHFSSVVSLSRDLAWTSANFVAMAFRGNLGNHKAARFAF
jgi:hypothetical protein